METHTPVVLITGCSSGIGASLCHEFHQRGCTVIATARRIMSLQGFKANGLHVDTLDVTDKEDIARVINGAYEACGRIDILINNAGYALIGPSVELPGEALRAQLETNLFAPLDLIKAVAPGMKDRGNGKIVNIGSISGIVTTPFSGAYCASKAALHSLSDGLRMALSPFGIKVITVQPGAIQSQFGKTASKTAKDNLKPDSWYGALKAAINARAEMSQNNPTPAEAFSRVLAGIVLGNDPPPIVRLGKKSRFLPALKHILPTRTLDKILVNKFALDTLKGD